MTLEAAARRLAEAGIENARSESRRLLALALGVSREETLIAASPTSEQQARFEDLVARRAAHEPFAYIAGHKPFWNLNLAVGPGVLIPRPATETLIEEAMRLVPDPNAPLRIADLGTGSGALLLAALREFPAATGIGIEASDAALPWAQSNAATYAPGRAEIRHADWNACSGAFDLVFANPPYIPSAEIAGLEPEVALFEPSAALDGGADGLCAYRSLALLLPRILAQGGFALLELGISQEKALEPLFSALEIFSVTPDLANIPRCMVLRNGH